MFKIESDKRYDMPVVFGPTEIRPQSVMEDAAVIALSFETDPDALTKLLPPRVELRSSTPVVTLSHVQYRSVDFLGNRSYNEVVVGIPVEVDGRRGSYVPAIWVNEPGAMMLGREFQGLPKLMADIPDADNDGSNLSFVVSEYDDPVLSASARDLAKLDDQRLERINAAAREVRSFAWKYVPCCSGGADTDYLVESVMRWDYSEAWSGDADFNFHDVTFEQAPFSARVMAGLKNIPVVKIKGGLYARGRATIDRINTRRI